VALLGAAVPWVLVKGRADRRQRTIERALPDMLDLLVVSIEAGLALEGALQRVSERGAGALSEEIRRTLNEIALGRRRYDALVSLAERTQVPALQTLVNAMNQAERSGMHLGPVLRSQAEQLRTRRRQQAQERALKAPVKMLIPLAIFIFPAMFLVILGPAAIPYIS
jgi:tight adherence protein C